MRKFGIPDYPRPKEDFTGGIANRKIHQVKIKGYLSNNERDALRCRYKKCLLCSWGEMPEVLVIHHRDKNPRNNHIKNIMVLCRNCHYMVHQGLVEE